MGLLDWFKRRRKKKIDEEKKALDRTGKLRTEIQEHMEEESNKRKRKKESV